MSQKAFNSAFQPLTAMNRQATRLHYVMLDEETVLAWGRNPHAHHPEISAMANGHPCKSQCIYFAVEGINYSLALLQHPSLKQSANANIQLLSEGEVISQYEGNISSDDHTERLLYLFSQMPTAEQERFFSHFTGNIAGIFQLARSWRYRGLCMQLYSTMSTASFGVASAHWLTPSILYIEGETQDIRPSGEPRILMISEQVFENAVSRFIQLSERGFAFIVVFDRENVAMAMQGACLSYFSGHQVVKMQSMASYPAYGMEFIHFLNNKPPFHRQELRSLICQSLMDFTTPAQHAANKALIHKLQLFVELPAQHCTNPAEPFNMHFERVIPLGNDGVFVSGWMRDPYHLMESVEVQTALGFTLPMGEHLFRIKRTDVREVFQNSPHGDFDEDTGFIAYAPLQPHQRHRLGDLAELHGMTFKITLKGGITHIVQPDIQYMDTRAARDIVLKLVNGHDVSESMLMRCIGPAASTLQRKCMEEVSVKEVYEMGQQIENPRVSLSIPLYQRLDFLKVQFATMANDPSMREVEIIYVLDSPWQEAEVRDFLREYAHLYQLPVRLVIMKHNSGYAAASNTGTKYARGEYIVLLNSDVFPGTPGWALKMADFYERTPNIGALAPKLIYEDDSLQHAGMFFAKTTFPDWINLHYYKGYPRDYAPAMVSRPVPAVTGACLMMKRSLWEEIDRLSVDYVVGDFEDSDLCLKCAAMGLENWYYADAELYHLERQSVPLNNSYADSLAWRYNARQHTMRWNDLIDTLMRTYGAS
jgi:GT2 family glycosyltransferase